MSIADKIHQRGITMADKKAQSKRILPTAPERSSKEDSAYKNGFNAGEKSGIRQGQDKVRKLVLDFLEERYMRPDVKRNTPKAEAILAVTADLAVMLKEHKI